MSKIGDRNARTNDMAAFEQLYQSYSPYLMGICCRYLSDDREAEDVLQDAFVKIFSNLHRFHSRGEGSLKAWMSRIVINEALKTLKKKERFRKEKIEDIPEDIQEEEINSESVPTEVLLKMIRELPQGYRSVFNLYVLDGKSHREIAHLLHIKESTSASQLFKAKALLSQNIKQYLNSHE